MTAPRRGTARTLALAAGLGAALAGLPVGATAQTVGAEAIASPAPRQPARPAPRPASPEALLRLILPESEDALAPALRAASLMFAAQAEGRVNPQDLFAAAQADYARLLAALYSKGHYGGTISIRLDGREAAAFGPFDAPEQIDKIEVQITPGPLFRFSTASVTPLPGAAATSALAAAALLPEGFARGQPAESPLILAAGEAAVDAWRDAGHPQAEVATRRLTADHPAAQLEAALTIAPGPRARFGTLALTGNSGVRPDRLAKIAGFPKGRVFSPRELDLVVDRLRRSGVFRAISVTEAPVLGPDDVQDIEIALVDQPLRRLGFGAEASNGEGLQLSAHLLNRNLLGGAERLRLEASLAQIAAPDGQAADFGLTMSIDRPATLTPDTTLGVEAALAREDDGRNLTNRARIEGRLSHILSHLATLRGGIAWDYEASGRSGVPAAQQTEFRTLALPLGVLWDRRDNRLDPTKGHMADAEAKFFRSYSGTDDQGLRLTLDARSYRALRPGLVLAGRVQGGAVLGAKWGLTPRSYLFRSGGAGTVRGQPFEALAEPLCRTQLPGGEDPCSVGGTHFLGSSLEVRADVTGKIGAVGFADYGRIGIGTLTDARARWHAGAGIGLRYDTGIGPLRLDIARPLGDGDTTGGTQIYIGIGQAF